MKPYTKTGDKGETNIISGRVKKTDEIIRCLGSIDELTATIGLARLNITDDEVRKILEKIENKLSKVAIAIAGGNKKITLEDVKETEEIIDKYYIETEDFIKPKKKDSAFLHLARSICRRVEVNSHRINAEDTILMYLNRLSDLLFSLATHVDKNE